MIETSAPKVQNNTNNVAVVDKFEIELGSVKIKIEHERTPVGFSKIKTKFSSDIKTTTVKTPRKTTEVIKLTTLQTTTENQTTTKELRTTTVTTRPTTTASLTTSASTTTKRTTTTSMMPDSTTTEEKDDITTTSIIVTEEMCMFYSISNINRKGKISEAVISKTSYDIHVQGIVKVTQRRYKTFDYTTITGRLGRSVGAKTVI